MTDPLTRFRQWQDEAAAAGVTLPEAMTLATADEAGRPSARTVLLKGVDERGFVFFTNYESRKGRQLAANPHAALTFLWHMEPRAAGSRHRNGGEGCARGVGGVLPDARRREPPRGLGIPPELAARRPGRARERLRRGRGSLRRRRSAARLVGRLCPPAGDDRVLGEPPDRLHERICYTRADDAWSATLLSP